MTNAFAFGKIILFGEHAVVYGRPAIAVPVSQVRAEATLENSRDEAVQINAPDLARTYALSDAPSDDPIAAIVRLTCAHFEIEPRGFSISVHSTIPIGGGLGSGAAVSVATARAIAKHFARELSASDVSALAYQVEKLHHGTPSGIDNTVIAFEQPVWFVRGNPIESFRVARAFTMAIADTGIAAPTKIAVGDVRRSWEANRDAYEKMFDEIGSLVRNARVAIERGEIESLGALMTANQGWLEKIGVSSPEIETLVQAAMNAGALGAKLSGGGRGGNVIALVNETSQERVARALMNAGAKRVIVTLVES